MSRRRELNFSHIGVGRSQWRGTRSKSWLVRKGLLMSEPLVVVGNGMAAMRLVEELARRALGRYAVAVIGDEPRLAYNRVLLSSVLAQEVSARKSNYTGPGGGATTA
jgi:FlaA1/EpsC-like NDP-sugar epimerase